MIRFYSQSTPYVPTPKRPFYAWLNAVAREERKRVGELAYIFCDASTLLNMNREFLHHDYYTDVITFPYEASDGAICGDVFIDVDTVRANALTYNATFEHEMQRVMVHGLLHLIGYKDSTEEEQLLMRAKEDFYLQSRPQK